MFKSAIDAESNLAILEPRHAAELYQLVDESRDSIGEWLAFPKKTNKIEDSKIFIEKSLKRLTENNGYWAGIWHKEKMAGSIGFLYMDWNTRKTEIGYWLGDNFKGKGLATKAVSRFILHAFHNLDLNKVEINAARTNEKSRAIPERLGFQQEGIIRDYEYINGEYRDRVVYGL
ncbi:GNAT family N-acetyltransferase [Gracilibacillus caseinilyticus]|uniref:GNAT family N-acetyltransferase n=1 Tax=Gracilibacillus caseinilyticus TaxID=2932256 RepID=A0ABY4EXG2_9BACI|nr:GNAT family protein [Gracilibacillus caseinilyticus]UOQ46841.1 GNAT family N-acetyltransferase [Gracilibacillus caseinilyticus]